MSDVITRMMKYAAVAVAAFAVAQPIALSDPHVDTVTVRTPAPPGSSRIVRTVTTIRCPRFTEQDPGRGDAQVCHVRWAAGKTLIITYPGGYQLRAVIYG